MNSRRASPILFIVLLGVLIGVVLYWKRRRKPTPPKDELLREIKEELKVLHPRFRNIHLYEGNESYTLNKEYVYICLRDENGEYYSKNMLIYVVLHEYAHVLCDEVDDVTHSEKFFTIFQRLLNKAIQMGMYDPSIPPVKNYCGVTD